ncbi:MAG: hypothetical protein WA091_01885 [Minisyncoccales bacterium]
MENKTTGVAKLAFLGASLAGIAATAYFFFGPKGKKNQKHVKAWAIKMKGDVIEKLETARDITEPAYHEIIESVAREYKKGKRAGQIEIDELAKDLKKHWKTISKSAQLVKKDVLKGVKKNSIKISKP